MRESGRASDDFVLLRTRLEERILRQPVDIDEAKEWSAQLSLDGSWPDIDYASRAAANFPGEQHWRRLSAILLACKEGAFDVSKEEVSGQIRKASLTGLAIPFLLPTGGGLRLASPWRLLKLPF